MLNDVVEWTMTGCMAPNLSKRKSASSIKTLRQGMQDQAEGFYAEISTSFTRLK
jgi:hypothetical protein